MGSRFLLQSDYFLDRLQPRLDRSRVRRLRVDANERLGTARATQHPATVLEVELEAVVRTHPRDLDAGDLFRLVVRQLLGDPLAVAVVCVALQVNVVARVRVGPDALLEVANDLRQRLAAPHDHVGEKHPDEDAVALGDVAANTESARLLPTDDGVGLHHLRRDVFESDLDLVDLGVELLRQLLDHRGHVHRLDDRAAHPEHVEQVQHEQREHLQLIDEPAGLVDDADAVGVAVGEDAQVVAAALHDGDRLVDVGWDGLRVQAAEERVAVRVQLRDSGLAAAEKLGHVAVPRSMHAFVHHAQARVAKARQVHHASYLLVVRGARVVHGDELRDLLPIGALDLAQSVDALLELADDRAVRGAPGLGLVLDAVEQL